MPADPAWQFLVSNVSPPERRETQWVRMNNKEGKQTETRGMKRTVQTNKEEGSTHCVLSL